MAHSSTGTFTSSLALLLLIHSRLGRNIKGFMIQGGDPTGTGKAGESIWGGWFNDEIRPTVKACSCPLLLHKQTSERNLYRQFNTRGMVAMANKGSDQNGSQFFITYAKQSHLDGAHYFPSRLRPA